MVKKSFGKRVREVLEEKDMTKEELGERLSMSPRSVRRYTSESEVPSAKMVKRIADALEVDAGHLVAGMVPKHAKKMPVDNTSYDIAVSIINSYSYAWTEEQKTSLMNSLLNNKK